MLDVFEEEKNMTENVCLCCKTISNLLIIIFMTDQFKTGAETTPHIFRVLLFGINKETGRTVSSRVFALKGGINRDGLRSSGNEETKN
jgi:hypothetical protein